MKVMIVGAAGQVGTCLVERLQSRSDVELISLDKAQLDITDKKAVFALISQYRPDIIFNAAAYTAVDKAEQEIDLCYAINCDGPKYLAQAADEIGAAILHISTDYVFSGDKDGMYTEEDTCQPSGEYGKSKLAGEIAVRDACEKHIILRTAWVFGEHGNNFVKTMLRLGKTRNSLGIVDDQFGGPTYAGDIANVLISMAEKILREKDDVKCFGTYHFSGQPYVTWYEFANEIFTCAYQSNSTQQIPQLTRLTTEEYPTPAKRPANSRLDCSKISRVFAVLASDWRDALSNIQAYFE